MQRFRIGILHGGEKDHSMAQLFYEKKGKEGQGGEGGAIELICREADSPVMCSTREEEEGGSGSEGKG